MSGVTDGLWALKVDLWRIEAFHMTGHGTGQVTTLQGAGRLEDPDGHSTSVSYSLHECEEIIDAGDRDNPNDTLRRKRTLEGTIRAGRLPLARVCVLHLEDGFRIKVILKASDGHVAQVDSTGPPF